MAGPLNYTTTIDVFKTVGEVQGMLAAHGAQKVMIEYDTAQQPAGLVFQISTEVGDRMFSIPVNVDSVHALLLRQGNAGKLKSLSKVQWQSREQAARVAWRVIKDWVEAQLAIIQAQMVTLDQVMLPYMRTGIGSKTVFDDYRDSLALTTGKDDSE